MEKFVAQFSNTLKRIHKALGNDAFRTARYRSFSVPIYDAFMVAVAGNESATPEMINAAYTKLRVDEKFLNLSRSSTTNTHFVKQRIRMVREALDAAS